MPIRQWIDRQRRRVMAEVTGSFTMEEIIATINGAVEDPDFEPGFDILSNHFDLENPITTPQVKELARHLSRMADKMAGSRWAVVVSSTVSYGMMRMLSVYGESVPMEIRVFQSLPDAEQWLNSPKRGDQRTGD